MASVYVCLDEPAPVAQVDCTAWDVVAYEPSPFALDAPAAVQIAVAVLSIWALGFVFRTLARHVRES